MIFSTTGRVQTNAERLCLWIHHLDENLPQDAIPVLDEIDFGIDSRGRVILRVSRFFHRRSCGRVCPPLVLDKNKSALK